MRCNASQTLADAVFAQLVGFSAVDGGRDHVVDDVDIDDDVAHGTVNADDDDLNDLTDPTRLPSRPLWQPLTRPCPSPDTVS